MGLLLVTTEAGHRQVVWLASPPVAHVDRELPGLRPDLRFAEAASVGLQLDLETATIEAAVEALTHLPGDVYLSVNASPDLILSRRIEPVIAAIDPSRIVVEVTEHAPVANYDDLLEAVDSLRRRGVRLAVDDAGAGAGFASLNHILRLQPDIVKLDITLTRNVDSDPVRRALTAALAQFCDDTGATLVAEGVENREELDAMLFLGVTCAQGFFLGRPGPLPLPTGLPQPTPRHRETTSTMTVERAEIAQTDLEALCRRLIEQVLAVTGFDVGYVTLRRPGAAMLDQLYVTGRTDRFLAPREVPWDESLCAACRARGILWTADAQRDLSRATNIGNAQSFLSLPFQDTAGVDIGSLCAVAVEPRYLSAKMLEQVRTMSTQIGEWINRLGVDAVPLFLEN